MSNSIHREWLRDAGFCLAAAYVALLPQFYLVYERGNRFALDWSPTVRTAILSAIAIVAAAYWVLYAGAWWLGGVADGWQRRVSAREVVRALALWVLTAVFLRSAMAIVYATRPPTDVLARMVDSNWAKILGYLVLPAGLLLCCRRCYGRIIRGVYGVAGAMFVLFVVQTFVWKHDVAGGKTEGRHIEEATPAARGGLYIFMFDGWGYDPTFGNPAFSLTNMPHLSALLEQATLFHAAYSPGIETWVSIPRFVFQNDARAAEYSYAEMRNLLFNHGDFSHLNSIFDLSARHYKFIGQSAINYAVLLGGRVDGIQPFYADYARYFLKERVRGLLGTQLAFLRKFGFVLEARPLGDDSLNESWWRQQARIRPVLNDVLPRLPANPFVLVHMLIPHRPYGFRRDGTLRIPPGMSDPDGSYYLDNVYGMDAIIGDIVRILRERGEYDEALIVITSDHGLRPEDAAAWEDLDVETWIPEKHVPLIVKYPRQKHRADARVPLTTAQLHPLFSDFLDDPQQVARWAARQDAGDGKAVLYGRE